MINGFIDRLNDCLLVYQLFRSLAVLINLVGSLGRNVRFFDVGLNAGHADISVKIVSVGQLAKQIAQFGIAQDCRADAAGAGCQNVQTAADRVGNLADQVIGRQL